MKSQVYNPYLPEWEYVPDGEPHVFDGRVYVYGSHDRFGAPMFCVDDYVCWSAPVDDLSAWREEGVIYRKNQDPCNPRGTRLLFAPDVARGTDGRFYLFYAFDFMGTIGVAVCDEPAGAFEFYGHVSWPDGVLYGRRPGDGFGFDPAVLVDDDGRVWLYSGFKTFVPRAVTGGVATAHDGAYVLELEPDMLTILGQQRLLLPCEGPGAFAGHGFFEASSIRKFGEKYVFVYSSEHNHELCYAVSDRPDGGFEYGGVLVSIGDVGLPGHVDEAHATNYLGNTHGGLLRIGDDYYVFYHRQTNRCSYARQACAEKLELTADGHFLQAEVTSCGLNGGPLASKGVYPARIACNLWSRRGVGRVDGRGVRRRLAAHPYFTQEGKGRSGHQYIAGMRDGAVAGFKYFDLTGTVRVKVWVRGRGRGVLRVASDEGFKHVVATVFVDGLSREWRCFEARLAAGQDAGKCALFFRTEGDLVLDFKEFELE